MKQSHHPEWRITKYGHDTRAIWAKRPTGSVVVFIHGFAGSTVGTFPRLPDLLVTSGKHDGTDVVSYGYAFGARAEMSATLFGNFLTDLATAPAPRVINPTLRPDLQRSKAFQYDRITVVGHSTGAIVTRKALLDIYDQRPRPSWLDRVRLIFFAPAHRGAEVIPISVTDFPSTLFMAGLRAIATLKAPLWKDLAPKSELIAEITDRTADLLPGRGADPPPTHRDYPHLIAQKVFIGELDTIVKPGRFCWDPPAKVVPNHTHTSVCKSESRAGEPYRLLLDELG